jgi:putative DNA primase/helicase
MSDPLQHVRMRFDAAEDVEPVASLAAVQNESGGSIGMDKNVAPMSGDDAVRGGGPRTPVPDLSENPFFRASEQPLNDYGNGQRFVIHFGKDVIFVPRIGWHIWTGKVWQFDPSLNSKNGITSGGIAVRSKAQQIWKLIEQEVEFINPTKREEKQLAEERQLTQDLKALEETPAAERAETHDAEIGKIIGRLRALEGMLKDRKSLIGRRLTHAKNAGNNGPLGHMLTESTTDLAVDFEDLDANPLDVNTDSGLLRFSVIDMTEEGAGKIAACELLPHARDQLLTKLMPVSYNSKSQAPMFEAFLDRVQPDIEMRAFLQRWYGLNLTALKTQKLAFFYGVGANGKSVLNDILARIMAGYSASIKIESLTGVNRRSGAEATPDLIPMLGGRSVRTSEPEQGERLQEGLIKQLTGGEKIAVRPNYGDQIEMEPFFKLTMSGNYKPEIHGGDDGIWRRVMLIPFDVQIPESERDDKLGDKLWLERDGIFNWMVEGLIDYLEGGLHIPQSVVDATAEYRRDSDPIGAFLMNCCNITGDHDDKILSKDLGSAFNYYLMERGETTWKPTTFAKQISSKAKHWKHPETAKQFEKGKASLSQYTGLRFTDAFKYRLEAAPKDSSGRVIGVAADMPPDPI